MHWSDVMKNEECDFIMPLLHQEVRLRRLKMLGHICRNDPPAKNILKKSPSEFQEKKRQITINHFQYINKGHELPQKNMNKIEKIDKYAYREIINCDYV